MIGRLFKKKSVKSTAEGSTSFAEGSSKGTSSPQADGQSGGRFEKGASTSSQCSKQKKTSQAHSGRGRRGKKNHSQSRSRSQGKNTDVPWSVTDYQVPEVAGKTRFHDLDIDGQLLHAVADLGFEYCSPIQAQSLPHSLSGHDVVGKAQTGTGKTAAFLLTLIDDLIKNPITEDRYAGETRALVIAPTRELVIQIAEDAKLLTKYTELKVHTIVGGMDYGKQQRRLHEELVDILVATPGRLLDFCQNKDVYLDQVEVLVIDEADRMLDMGFIPQVRRIIRQTPQKTHRQTLLFSATFTEDVLRLSEQWTMDPVKVEIEPESVAADAVTQHIYLAATEEKFTMLYNVLQQEDVDSMLVFANRRDEVRDLYEGLRASGLKVGILSGEVPQNRRVKTLDDFKSGRIKVLVATDVAGRGIHIDGISHVVNFTLPEEPEDYVHRIGRTGRAGKRGTSISFACEDDAFRLMPIEELLGKKLICSQPPEHLLVDSPDIKLATGKGGQRSERRRSGQGGGRARRGNHRRHK